MNKISIQNTSAASIATKKVVVRAPKNSGRLYQLNQTEEGDIVTFRAKRDGKKSSLSYKKRFQGVRLICKDHKIKKINKEGQPGRRSQSKSYSRISHNKAKLSVEIAPRHEIPNGRKLKNLSSGKEKKNIFFKVKRKKKASNNAKFSTFKSFNEMVSKAEGNKRRFKISKNSRQRGSIAMSRSAPTPTQALTLQNLPIIEDEESVEEEEEEVIGLTEKEIEEKVFKNLAGILTVLDYYLLKNKSERNEKKIKKELYSVYRRLINRCLLLANFEKSVMVHSLILAKRTILFGKNKHEFKPGEFYLIYCACLFLSIKYVEDVEEWYLEDFTKIAKIDKESLHEMEIIVGINMLDFGVHSDKKEMDVFTRLAVEFEKKEVMNDSGFIERLFKF